MYTFYAFVSDGADYNEPRTADRADVLVGYISRGYKLRGPVLFIAAGYLRYFQREIRYAIWRIRHPK